MTADATAASRVGRRDPLAVPATVLVGIWAAVSVVLCVFTVATQTASDHGALLDSEPLNGLGFLIVMLLPIAALNLLVAATVIGCIAAARTRPRSPARVAALLAVVAGGFTVQLWAATSRAGDPSSYQVEPAGFMHDGRFDAVVIGVVGVVMALLVALLLRVLRGPTRR